MSRAAFCHELSDEDRIELARLIHEYARACEEREALIADGHKHASAVCVEARARVSATFMALLRVGVPL